MNEPIILSFNEFHRLLFVLHESIFWYVCICLAKKHKKQGHLCQEEQNEYCKVQFIVPVIKNDVMLYK